MRLDAGCAADYLAAMSTHGMKKPFNSLVASFLTIPSALVLFHLVVAIIYLRPSLAREERFFIIHSGVLLASIALVCGIWAIIYSLDRSGPASSRHLFVALNALPVFISELYVGFFFFARQMPGGPG
jgi:hypothetical protein